jgi:predicted acyl esterase
VNAISPDRLLAVAPDLERILARGGLEVDSSVQFGESSIRCETVSMPMRDGVRLATDLYLPPVLPASAIVMRTPYGRRAERFVAIFRMFATRGYVVISQDCRGTGDSEPDSWDYCVYESEDGIDCVSWIVAQEWFGGFLCSFGGSYVATTQWCMSAHPQMSAIAPEVAGLRMTRATTSLYMFVNAYPRVVGKGENRLDATLDEIERLIESETMAGGYFDAPLRAPLSAELLDEYPELATLPLSVAKRRLWAECCRLPSASRVKLLKRILGVEEFSYVSYSSLPAFFDCLIPYGMNTIPSVDAAQLCQRFHAPVLFIAGWYDWNLGDALPSWTIFCREARPEVVARSRLIITPAAHRTPGYHEADAQHPELKHDHRSNVALLLRWFETIRDGTEHAWPRVIYYLMGANEWRVATAWPVPGARPAMLYLRSGGVLSPEPPDASSSPDQYVYDPCDPTPTVGGSIVSFHYPCGSVDVSEVQRRADVLTYTSEPLLHDLDVVGPLRLILYVSSSAADTDFAGRLCDVFPDGRAIQLQNGILRARFRDLTGDPELMVPGRIYRLEIDLWATANRFKAGHRVRVDISSADFPRFDRNTNRGGEPGPLTRAIQTIHHDPDHPSHLELSVIG